MESAFLALEDLNALYWTQRRYGMNITFSKFKWLSVLILMQLGMGTATALPIVTYDTFGPNDHYSGQNGTRGFSYDIGQDYSRFDRHVAVAAGFALDNDGGELTFGSIDLAIGRGTLSQSDQRARISLFADQSGTPAALIEEFLVFIDTSRIYHIDSLLEPTLLPETRYWLVVESTGRLARHSWKLNGLAPHGTYTGPVISASSDQSGWRDRSRSGQPAFRVTANSTNAVPLPHTIFLVLIGFIGWSASIRL